jgi:hypothetical protein
MPRKNSTKKDKLQPNRYTFLLPEGALKSDKFEARTITDGSLEDIGIRRGDVAIVYLTSKIQSYDIISYRAKNGACYIGEYQPKPARCIQINFLSKEYDPLIYRSNEGKVLGRVIHFERDRRII